MILSLAHATLLHVPPPEFIRTAAAAGFGSVGLRLIPIGFAGEPRYDAAVDQALRRDIAAALAETGVRFMDVEVVVIGGSAAGGLGPALDCAAELGARFAIVNVYEPERSRAADALGELCALALHAGITMLVEPVGFSAIGTVGDAIALARACGSPNTGILPDVLHVHSSGEHPSVLTQVPPAQLPFIHLCDAPAKVPADPEGRRQIARAGRLLPGEGGIDLPSILSQLPPGTVHAVEAHNPARALALGAEGYARLAFETTRNWLFERAGRSS